MLKRILLDLSAIVSIFVLPWWCAAILIFCIIVLFRNPLEAVVIAFLADFLYSVPEARFHGFIFVFGVSAFVVFLIVKFLRTRLRTF